MQILQADHLPSLQGVGVSYSKERWSIISRIATVHQSGVIIVTAVTIPEGVKP